ncbi:MAG: sigma-70 family RNA polymerase sigma factor [Clostridium sp.]|uniref:sigma-70 family RNA polymerase sigma factor n=1 Tax=Clostridium sp. TaxID=1506 RepID=UPI003041EBF4
MDKKLIRIAKDEVKEMTFDEVLKKYRGLVVNKINKWKFKYEFDDLYQMGCLGLWDAYKYHDSNNGFCFGTLALKTIIHYISWYRQNNNLDKINRQTSKITDVCSYDSKDGYVDTFMDTRADYDEIELKLIINDVIVKLNKQNEFLRAHERRASERNIIFLKLVAQGISQREIAEIYNLSISTVQRGVYKEYSRIKKFLKASSYEELMRA